MSAFTQVIPHFKIALQIRYVRFFSEHLEVKLKVYSWIFLCAVIIFWFIAFSKVHLVLFALSKQIDMIYDQF